MKLNFLKIGFYATMFAMALFVVSCGGGTDSHEGHDHQHQQGQEQHDHDHDGHQHEQGEQQQGHEETSIDKTGKEYTSAYVCPMHCEGSGSETAGTCPKCKMDYVANADYKK